MIEALYLHIPFCKQRCSYCDFVTRACDDDALMDAYVEALSLSVRRAARAGVLSGIKTVYIGGGTPSHLGLRRLTSLVYALSVSIDLGQVEEFTLEANPESLSDAMVRDLYALGVGRFSIGAQSFDDAVLREYGRIHDVAAIDRAVAAVKQRPCEFSLDLICGSPGQSLASWEHSVERAIASGAGHVSIYPLMLEEGTELSRRVEQGMSDAPKDDVEADMMLRAAEILEAAGFERYEVASYARPGCEAKHNTAYWTGVEYLGLGAGAASMLSPTSYLSCRDAGLFGEVNIVRADESLEGVPQDCRRVRLAMFPDSRAYASSGGKATCDAECLTKKEAILEDLMLGMRMSCGISQDHVLEGTDYAPELPDALESLQDKGLVTYEDGRWRPTQKGWLLGNEVYGAIWDLAE